MPYTITWEEPCGLYLRLTGVVSPSDFRQIAALVVGDPRYDNLRYSIADFLQADGHSFTPGDFRQLADAVVLAIGASYANPYVYETAVTVDPGLRELLQSYAELMRNHRVEVFATVAEARDWIATQTYSIRRSDMPD